MGTKEIDKVTQAVGAYFKNDDQVIAVYCFGSVAREDSQGASDIDLALLMRGGFDYVGNFDYVLKAKGALEDALGVSVDVVMLNHADPVLQYQVRRDGVVVLEKNRKARIEWEVRSRKLWFDLQPAHRLYADKMAKRYAREYPDG